MFEANPGGAPCNVLAQMAKLGLKTAFIGKVGKDWRGIYTKTKEGIKYYWKYYLQDPELELEVL